MKRRITITIDKDLLEEFREVCNKHGYKMSTKIEILVRNFLEKGEK